MAKRYFFTLSMRVINGLNDRQLTGSTFSAAPDRSLAQAQIKFGPELLEVVFNAVPNPVLDDELHLWEPRVVIIANIPHLFFFVVIDLHSS